MLVQRLSFRTHVARAKHRRVLLGQRGRLREVAAELRELDRVAVQVREIARDDAAACVGPRTLADAIARVDGVRSLRAQVRAPDSFARAGLSGRRGELLAMRVGALQTAEIPAVTDRRSSRKSPSAPAGGLAPGCCAARSDPATMAAAPARTKTLLFISISL